jgi:hypothetical protein
MVDNLDYDAPFEKKKQLTHNEVIYIKDFKICEKYSLANKLENKSEESFQVRNPMGFNDDKLDSFYKELMRLTGKTSIFAKIAEVKDKIV